MAETTMEPWSFTIVFDEDKAKKNGYEVDTLYDYVGKNVEGLGNERIARGTWRAAKGYDEVDALNLVGQALKTNPDHDNLLALNPAPPSVAQPKRTAPKKSEKV